MHLPCGQALKMPPFLCDMAAFLIQMAAYLWSNAAITRRCPRPRVLCSRREPGLDVLEDHFVHVPHCARRFFVVVARFADAPKHS